MCLIIYLQNIYNLYVTLFIYKGEIQFVCIIIYFKNYLQIMCVKLFKKEYDIEKRETGSTMKSVIGNRKPARGGGF